MTLAYGHNIQLLTEEVIGSISRICGKVCNPAQVLPNDRIPNALTRRDDQPF